MSKCLANSNKSRTGGEATKKGEIRQPELIRWVQIIAWCLRSSRHFQCWGRRARHCFSHNVPRPSRKFDRLSSQARAHFVPSSDACNPNRSSPVQACIRLRGPPVSWRRANHDTPGSQINCAPSRAHPAQGAAHRALTTQCVGRASQTAGLSAACTESALPGWAYETRTQKCRRKLSL
jgi:hypothetical protein